MRIISGTYGGRRLSPPKNITARPTTDFAKESLFNLLNNRMDFEGIDMLDLFAGTGGIGIECVSRGARSVTAVEIAHVQQNWIITCCRQLDIHNLSVIRGDVFKFLNACHTKYDLIFADPPYALEELPLLPEFILGRDILKENGWLVIEHGKDTDFTSHPRHIETRTYGSVHFSFFQ
ncbi:MAG: 16S rRNA (guanine(966)-N(2))-methyltransferase RsmD [Paludibacteraceae bacterium]|nr:16S rRNA (guanine(966)-N(2))-methyltransferase RsmD [Paludibacteraceae bacterium]